MGLEMEQEMGELLEHHAGISNYEKTDRTSLNSISKTGCVCLSSVNTESTLFCALVLHVKTANLDIKSSV